MNRLQAMALLLTVWVGPSAAAESVVPIVILGYPEFAQSRIAAIEKTDPRRMTFNLRSVGAKGDQKVFATVQGSLTDDEVTAVLRVVPLIHHVRSLVGPWMLSIVGDDRYVKVVVRAVWDCRNDGNTYKDWVLAATDADWRVVARDTRIVIEFCDPVQ